MIGLGSFCRESWTATRTPRDRACSRCWRSRWPSEGVAGVGGHAELRVDDTAWRVRYRDVDQSERKVMSRTFTATLTLRCRRAGGGREPMTELSFRAVSTVDYHTGGEPFRIVAAPPVDLPGSTVAERRVRAIQDPQADGLRKLLCLEPPGHADMYGGFLTPPDDPGADFGVLFWHKDGFSTACGHGTIALGVWAVETGRVQAATDGATQVRIDVPSGRVLARVHTEAGRGHARRL